MSDTAVTKLPGNFTQVFFVVHQQFFHPFNFQVNQVFLDGGAFYRRKERTQVWVIQVQFAGEVV